MFLGLCSSENVKCNIFFQTATPMLLCFFFQNRSNLRAEHTKITNTKVTNIKITDNKNTSARIEENPVNSGSVTA